MNAENTPLSGQARRSLVIQDGAQWGDLAAFDVESFTRGGGHVSGQLNLKDLSRLFAQAHEVDGAVDAAETPVQWSFHGLQKVVSGETQHWVHIQAKAKVPMVCQRCLQPMWVEVLVDRNTRFVADEAAAKALDDDSEDDVLAMMPRPDWMEWLEDEILLDLPIVPRHEMCPRPLPMQTGEDDLIPAPSPFAVLAALKKK